MDLPFTTPLRVDSTDSQETRCYPSYMYNRDTYQMSPLLFESDTDDASQSTETKCYQAPVIATQPTTDYGQMLSNLPGEIDSHISQLVTSSQHNECCSETLLNSSNRHRTVIETKRSTNSAYISPSPRVTRSKLWRSRILTRSAKRLHKISESSEHSSLGNSRKAKSKKDLQKEIKTSSNDKDVPCKASDKGQDEEKLIESIRKSKVCVVLERLKLPFFQNPHQVNRGKFVQPNVVPNIVLDNDEDDGLDFLNRRPSSEVQMLSERPVVVSISSESTIRNVSTTPRASPDLFDNFDSSSASNLCSQNSLGIPNGQIAMLSSAELRGSNSATCTPNNHQDSTQVPSIFDVFDEDGDTPEVNVNVERQKLLAAEEDTNLVPQPTFEITVNEVFDNVIYVTDSEETLVPQIVNPVESPSETVSVNFLNVTKCVSSQEVTPKKRPEIRNLVNRSTGAYPSSSSISLSRTKWLSKPRCSDGGNVSSRTPQRCRRLDRWFDNDRDSKPKRKGYVVGRNVANILSTSSEDDDS